MTDAALDELVRSTLKEIEERPICKPGPGETAEFCPYSRTGLAVHTADGMCTCKPVNKS